METRTAERTLQYKIGTDTHRRFVAAAYDDHLTITAAVHRCVAAYIVDAKAVTELAKKFQ